MTLTSSNPDIARVPSNITVAAGSTSNTFRVDTSSVRDRAQITIIAGYAGESRNAVLTINPPELVARFTVTSPNRGSDACDIINASGAIDCVLDASTSTGIAAGYRWTLTVGSTESTFTSDENDRVVTASADCGLLSNGTAEDGRIQMEVALRLEDRSGNVTAAARRTVSVFHNGRCGF